MLEDIYVEMATNILKDKNIFAKFISEFEKKIVNEREACATIFLVCCGSLVENAKPTSTNLCVSSNSGAGKDWVVDNILKIFPKLMVEKRKRISPTAFSYWHNAFFEPEWTWNGKLCYLEDVSNDVLNSDVFKLMSSNEDKQATATIVVKGKSAIRSMDYVVDGKPILLTTTASAQPREELIRRFPFVSLDETIEQTKAIVKQKLEIAKTGKSENYDESLIKSFSYLKRVKVKIPFADKFEKLLPLDNIIIRTQIDRLLDYIKFSCALHQLQRKIDEDGFHLAEWQDYVVALMAFKPTISNPMTIPLTKKQRRFLSTIQTEFKDNSFKVAELEPKVPFLSQKSIYQYLAELQEWFFDLEIRDVEGQKKPVRFYKLKNFETKLLFPSPNELKD